MGNPFFISVAVSEQYHPGVAIVARQSGAETPPPPGAKKAPLRRGIGAETPGAPLRGAPKRVKKGSKNFFPRWRPGFWGAGRPFGAPIWRGIWRGNPPPGLKNAPMPRRRASLIATHDRQSHKYEGF